MVRKPARELDQETVEPHTSPPHPVATPNGLCAVVQVSRNWHAALTASNGPVGRASFGGSLRSLRSFVRNPLSAAGLSRHIFDLKTDMEFSDTAAMENFVRLLPNLRILRVRFSAPGPSPFVFPPKLTELHLGDMEA